MACTQETCLVHFKSILKHYKKKYISNTGHVPLKYFLNKLLKVKFPKYTFILKHYSRHVLMLNLAINKTYHCCSVGD